MKTSVLIVGGGLAGLHLARRLHQAGVDFLLLEARDRLGGRILSTDGLAGAAFQGFDLGPSWFWPGSQPQLAAVIDELGLSSFPQHTDGDVIFQRMSREAPHRYRGSPQEPQSMRLVGGAAALPAAIAAQLPADRLRTGVQVTGMTLGAEGVETLARTPSGDGITILADQVVLALPPRLVEATIDLAPPADPASADLWRETATWMAPHAKFFAIYDRPFWRDAGLSGAAQSMVGPLVEIHDATTASGAAALFGFIGVPAAQRAALGEAALVRASLDQLSQLFGSPAARPVATVLKDWALDPLTATQADQTGGAHLRPHDQPWVTGAWQDRLWLAGSETSATEPGYLAGAIDAAKRVAQVLIARLPTDERKV